MLANGVAAYFDRSYRAFCSHRQTPSSGLAGSPAIVRNGQVIYFAHPLFTQYNQNAPRWCKQLFLNAMDLLLPEPLVRHQGPSTLRVAVNEQPDRQRWVVHLLHYVPERRGQDFDVIEDVIPLHNLLLSLRAPGKVAAVNCVPGIEPLPHRKVGDRIEFVLPELKGHQMLEIRFNSR